MAPRTDIYDEYNRNPAWKSPGQTQLPTAGPRLPPTAAGGKPPGVSTTAQASAAGRRAGFDKFGNSAANQAVAANPAGLGAGAVGRRNIRQAAANEAVLAPARERARQQGLIAGIPRTSERERERDLRNAGVIGIGDTAESTRAAQEALRAQYAGEDAGAQQAYLDLQKTFSGEGTNAADNAADLASIGMQVAGLDSRQDTRSATTRRGQDLRLGPDSLAAAAQQNQFDQLGLDNAFRERQRGADNAFRGLQLGTDVADRQADRALQAEQIAPAAPLTAARTGAAQRLNTAADIEAQQVATERNRTDAARALSSTVQGNTQMLQQFLDDAPPEVLAASNTAQGKAALQQAYVRYAAEAQGLVRGPGGERLGFGSLGDAQFSGEVGGFEGFGRGLVNPAGPFGGNAFVRDLDTGDLKFGGDRSIRGAIPRRHRDILLRDQ